MKRNKRLREPGQSLILIAISIAVLIVIVGLAIDASNAYAAQRKAQSTANAAAIAATKRLAMTRDNPGLYTNGDIRDEIHNIVMENGFAADQATSHYVDINGIVLGEIQNFNPDQAPPADAAYIRVRIDDEVHTYFIRVAGFEQVAVNASTEAYNITTGAPGCTAGIYPLGVYDQDFEMGETYWIWDGDIEDPEFPGNFGWLRWRPDPSYGSGTALGAALTPPGNLGDPTWGYFNGTTHVLGPGQVMYGSTGVSNAQEIQTALNYFIQSGEPLILPLWSQGSGQGSDTIFINSGFGIFILEQVCFNTNPNQCPGVPDDVPPGSKALKVTFLSYSYSGCSVSNPVLPGQGGGSQQYATAQGLVYVCSAEAVLLPPDEGAHLAVDVMHVVDSSGSMAQPLVGGGATKIAIEKDALVFFNNLMRPDLGDQLGLVKFQGNNNGVQMLSPLTSDMGFLNGQIQSLNATGLTPWGMAVLKGTDALYGAGRNVDNKPVLIIASDGAPTVDLDDQSNTDYQNLIWDEMTPKTLHYCYLKNSCDIYPQHCQAPAGGCPGYRVHDDGIEVMIDALEAADVVKGNLAVQDTWWVMRHGGTCGSNCPYFGVTARPEMEIFVIAIKGESQFSSSVLKYVATPPASEHYFEVYSQQDVEDIYTYIANAISGQLPYCYIDYEATLYGGGVQVQVMAGGTLVGLGQAGGDGAYVIPTIPADPYQIYSFVGGTEIGGINYTVSSGCADPGQIGLQAPLPQIYEVPVFLTSEEETECPEGTLEIPPPSP